MYRRLIIVSILIFLSLCGLSGLGYRAIRLQQEGLAGRRYAEFASVAEQIRQDVKGKLDRFISAEQKRPYTDYQYYYVPDNVADQAGSQMALLRSPLGDQMEHGLAYGYFQIEPGGSVISPFYNAQPAPQQNRQEMTPARQYLQKIKTTLLPVLNGSWPDTWAQADKKIPEAVGGFRKMKEYASRVQTDTDAYDAPKSKGASAKSAPQRTLGKACRQSGSELKIESLQQSDRQEQVITQQRATVEQNIRNAAEPADRLDFAQNKKSDSKSVPQLSVVADESSIVAAKDLEDKPAENLSYGAGKKAAAKAEIAAGKPASQTIAEPAEPALVPQVELQTEGVTVLKENAPAPAAAQPVSSPASDLVQIRIEPFVPLMVADAGNPGAIFGGDIFMLRHVQIEDRHFLQGFQLNDRKLLEEVAASARQFMREGMDFELDHAADEQAVAYTAVLDFGFGNLGLYLREIDPGWIPRQVGQMRNWYFGILSLVFVVVMLGVASLWRNVHAQLKLARQKDDFISAVSHELRTPLTSIRMYTEMLEKNWVKNDGKRQEYYSNMRQESERLSRLIENVLDFSRIQRGKKKYNFRLGDINACLGGIVDMLSPYAAQHGFTLVKEFAARESVPFDRDAVMQIAINLIDNAVKYARGAEDKTIIVRTLLQGRYVLIEVEDHGPGVPHNQRQKIFEEFYRIGEESRRETTGTGLGLALVKKFAQAHRGFVEIATAKPTGAIFRVALQTAYK